MRLYYKLFLIFAVFVAALILTIHQNNHILPSLPHESASLAKTMGQNEKEDYDLSSLQTLNAVLLRLSKCYVDPPRFNPKKMFKEAIQGVEDEVPSVIARFDDDIGSVEIQVEAQKQSFDFSKIDGPWSMSAVLKKVFKFLKQNIVHYGDVKPQDVEYAAINGMLSTLDPHTRLLPPDFYKEMKMDTEGEFGGLGIVISSPEGKLTINEVLEGTPADKEGLKCGDNVVQIEEESTVNMDLDEAVSKLRGKAGTKVKLWIMREGLKAARQVEIERAAIRIESVKYQMVGSSVGYIKMSSFQENTYEDTKNALEKLKQSGMKSLILNLRGNAGGLLDVAIAISDIFIFAGTVTTTHVPCNAPPLQPFPAKISGSEPNYPMVVLIDRGSASASEIVAGALKNHDRAVIMGERSFGKGSIQQLKELRDGSALKYTIGEYLTPGDISIQSIGIVPDVQLVPMIIGKKEVDIFFSDEDVFRESDLDRHLVSDKIIEKSKPKDSVGYVYISKSEKKDVCSLPFEKIVKDDYEVRIAHDFLKSVDNPNRLKMVQGSSDFFLQARSKQELELEKVFKKRKVDWEACAAETPLEENLEVEYFINSKKVDAFYLKAGSKSKIRVDVKNNGKDPVCRLYAITESDDKLLTKREFIFGKVQPGKKKSWELELEVPESYPSRSDPVEFTFFTAPEKKIFTAPEIRTAVAAAPQPKWNVAYEIMDDVEGNGNGILEPGEDGRLKVTVHNIGKGKSKSLAVAVKN
ncbi:MAG: MXAN_5808 family serine peptidase, partial [Pseudomonadota bacterium]